MDSKDSLISAKSAVAVAAWLPPPCAMDTSACARATCWKMSARRPNYNTFDEDPPMESLIPSPTKATSLCLVCSLPFQPLTCLV